jgi:hypothetical protein
MSSSKLSSDLSVLVRVGEVHQNVHMPKGNFFKRGRYHGDNDHRVSDPCVGEEWIARELP